MRPIKKLKPIKLSQGKLAISGRQAREGTEFEIMTIIRKKGVTVLLKLTTPPEKRLEKQPVRLLQLYPWIKPEQVPQGAVDIKALLSVPLYFNEGDIRGNALARLLTARTRKLAIARPRWAKTTTFTLNVARLQLAARVPNREIRRFFEK